MNKYYNDEGSLVILISTQGNAGWSTWNNNEEALAMDERIVRFVAENGATLENKAEAEKIVREILKEKYGNDDFNLNMDGWKDVKILPLPPHESFEIKEFEGQEYALVNEKE